MGEQSHRLDSWKAIAAYLDRDVRTVMRWSKAQGLPVHRVAGGKGRSVFAFSDELDAWLLGQPDRHEPDPAAVPAAPLPAPAPHPSRRVTPWRLAAALVVIVLGTAALPLFLSGREVVSVSASAAGIEVSDAQGGRRVIHRFDAAAPPVFARTRPSIADVDNDGGRDVVVGVAYYDEPATGRLRGGELLRLSERAGDGWVFAFDDHLAFRETAYTGPWALTDWQVGPGGRIAVAAHHSVWWPAIATVLDGGGHRLSTFINPGWIETLRWLDRDRLAMGGFSNARDAAMLAIVDTTIVSGQAPGTTGTPYECVSCASESAVFYATFARSELNRVTGSRFNRAQVTRLDDVLMVTTIEVPGDPLAATAIYEFDARLSLVSARYDDVYWEAHRRLEREGRLGHGRDACPERNGPPAVAKWEDEGWVMVRPGR